MKKILLAMLLSLSTLSASENIKLMTEIFPPFQYKHQGNTIGISTDIVNAIQKELKIDNKIEVMLWSKALNIVDSKKNTAIFSMLRTPERENKYKWVGPLSSMKLVFFKKKGSDITLETIEDAKKVAKIGVTKGVANFEMLSRQGFTNLEVIYDAEDEVNIKKLVDGSIALWPTLLKAGFYNARLQGLAGEIEPIENVVAFSGDLYIAFNIKTDDKVILKWQNALEKLQKDNTIENITKRYYNKETDYSLIIKIFIGIFFIVAIIIYHNRKLFRANKQLFQLQQELKEQAHRDPLTNLYNRRYFSEVAVNMISLKKREKQDIGIIMLDIDKFKLVNDTYGHGIGDDVLKDLASLLLKHTRASDIVARVGGEEFIILLPNTSLEESVSIANKLRKLIENSQIKIDDKNSLNFTISLGVTKVLENDTKIDTFLNRADEALYKAKESGRNRVCVN